MWFYVLIFMVSLYILKNVLSPKKKFSPNLPPTTSVKQGKISGGWKYSTGGRLFKSFSGIPYAAPPTGKRRFLRPEPAPAWEGELQCKKSSKFIQANAFRVGNPIEGKEDALVLNVYAPEQALSMPVMVWVHGGGYMSGSGTGELYGPEHFMDKDVVLVTLNYRLSVLGGLYLDGEKVPGNQCMRDQVLALQWVQENIGSFGGDKERVTIFGESAGGMSVMNHFLSPMSRGLFSAAIVQSGSVLNAFVGNDKHPSFYGKKLAEKLGCAAGDNVEDTLEKLQGLKADDIQQQQYFLEEFIRAPFPFKPIVDGGLVDDPFLPKEPLDMLKEGDFAKVPLMMGTNNDEGLLIKAFYEREPLKREHAWDNWGKIGPLAFFHREEDEVSAEEAQVCMEFRDKHFGQERFSSSSGTAAFTQMYGDLMFTAPADMAAKLIASHQSAGPVYHYLYNHQGPFSLYDIMTLKPWKLLIEIFSLKLFGLSIFSTKSGVCHADELFLMFKPHAFPVNLLRDWRHRKVSQNLVQLWTDFATHHDPTPVKKHWTKFDVNSPSYMEISGTGNVMMYPKGHQERVEEWADIYGKIPPYMAHKESETWKNTS